MSEEMLGLLTSIDDERLDEFELTRLSVLEMRSDIDRRRSEGMM